MKQLQRKNIQQVQPYTAARDLYKTGVFLDANENYRQLLEIDWTQVTDLNRYPDSTSDELRSKLVSRYVPGFSKENIFVGSGSDEIIDLLIRGFVEDTEEIVMMNPSYSVYEVQAAINNVRVKKSSSILIIPFRQMLLLPRVPNLAQSSCFCVTRITPAAICLIVKL